jgi:hypothetical protein
MQKLGWSSMVAGAPAAGIELTACRSVPPWPPGLTQDYGRDRIDPLLHGAATRDEVLAEADALAPDVLVVSRSVLRVRPLGRRDNAH